MKDDSKNFQLRTDVRENGALRRSFDALAKKTFGLTFEGWYQSGGWQEDYLPYALADGARVAANVSVSRCPMRLDGVRMQLVQLGTVMVDEACRGQGLARTLMESVCEAWTDRCDGMFLFANDLVLDFYPKFGFQPMQETIFERAAEQPGSNPAKRLRVTPLSVRSDADMQLLRRLFAAGNPFARFAMAGNEGLMRFYAEQFLSGGLRYLPEADMAVMIEEDGDTATVWDCFGGDAVPLAEVLAAVVSPGIRRVRLGFTPADPAGFTAQPLKEDDTTLFVRGDALAERLASAQLMFPLLAHA